MNNLTQQMWNIWTCKGSGGYHLPKALDEAVWPCCYSEVEMTLNKSEWRLFLAAPGIPFPFVRCDTSLVLGCLVSELIKAHLNHFCDH